MDYADKLDMMDDDCDIQGFPLVDCSTERVTNKYIQMQADGMIREPIMCGDTTVGVRYIDVSDFPAADVVSTEQFNEIVSKYTECAKELEIAIANINKLMLHADEKYVCEMCEFYKNGACILAGSTLCEPRYKNH